MGTSEVYVKLRSYNLKPLDIRIFGRYLKVHAAKGLEYDLISNRLGEAARNEGFILLPSED